jgi:hypothetical protein
MDLAVAALAIYAALLSTGLVIWLLLRARRGGEQVALGVRAEWRSLRGGRRTALALVLRFENRSPHPVAIGEIGCRTSNGDAPIKVLAPYRDLLLLPAGERRELRIPITRCGPLEAIRGLYAQTSSGRRVEVPTEAWRALLEEATADQVGTMRAEGDGAASAAG